MRNYLIFFTAGFSIFMYAIDATVIAVAFPDFTKELHASLLWSAWTISIYFIAVTMTMPLAGNFSDSFGRKKVFLFSLLLFTGSSLACGLAPSIYSLVSFRFFQGVGGACFLPVASGIASDHFPKGRETAIGLLSSIFGIGAVVGPNLGGWIVSRYSWRYIFYINVPTGLLLICLTMMLLKESGSTTRPRVDAAGIGLMSGSLLLFMLGFNLAGERLSIPSVALAGMFVLTSLLLAFFFFRHEKRSATPIIDTRLLESKAFAAANASNLVVGMTSMGLVALIPLYAVSVHGLSTLMSGVVLTPRSLAMAITAAVSSFFLRRVGYRRPMLIGFAGMGLTIILLAPGIFPSTARDTWGIMRLLMIILFLNGMAMGLVFPSSNNACIELMPEKVGTIVGVRHMFRNIGGVLAVSLVAFVLHLSRDAFHGFMIVFIIFGTLPLITAPLLFLMPSGKRTWR
jgi:EmrB/QacA subfamily drug resistance transporter